VREKDEDDIMNARCQERAGQGESAALRVEWVLLDGLQYNTQVEGKSLVF